MEQFRGPRQHSAEFATAGAVHEPLFNYRQQNPDTSHVPYPPALSHQQTPPPFHLLDPRRPHAFPFPISNEPSPWQPPLIQSGGYAPGFRAARPPFDYEHPRVGIPHWPQGGALFSPTSIQNEMNFEPSPLPFAFHPHQPMGFQPQIMPGPCSSQGLQGTRVLNGTQTSLVEESDTFVSNWLKTIDTRRSKVDDQEQGPSLKIPEIRSLVSEASQYLSALHSLHSQMVSLSDTHMDSWETLRLQVNKHKTQLLAIRATMDSPGVVDHVVKKVKRTRAKRIRIKKSRESKKIEKSKKTALAEEATEIWLQAQRQEELRLKTEEAVQCSAKGVLGEVKKKQNEIEQLQSLLVALRSLREHRKETKKKGDVILPVADTTFHGRAESLEKLLTQQRTVYEDEEHTLRVLMKEEIQEKMSFQQRKVHDPPLDEVKRSSDPLEPFRDYWLQAEVNSEAKAAIRGDWSCFEHPEGSTLPSDIDILPPSPSNPLWSLYCIKTDHIHST